MTDAKATSGLNGTRNPLTQPERAGKLGDKKVIPWKTPLFCVLTLLGICGLGALGFGLAQLGMHQGWWAGSAVSLSQVESIITIVVGGASAACFGSIGIFGLVKTLMNTTEKISPIGEFSTNLSVEKAISVVDASYDHDDDSGILDLAYCDPALGFGCVVDGTGHNNPRMQEALREHFDPFMRSYAEGLAAHSSTLEEATQYFNKSMHLLNIQFNNPNLSANKKKVYPTDKHNEAFENDKILGTFLDSTYKPAMSMAQVVRVEDRWMLLTAQAGDTMIVVEMPDGEIRRTQRSSHMGVGDGLKVELFDITGAKRVIGFSDGIGEFMTFAELTEIITTTESEDLFEKLKDQAVSDRVVVSAEKAANGANLKIFDRDNPGRHDDMGLFVLNL